MNYIYLLTTRPTLTRIENKNMSHRYPHLMTIDPVSGKPIRCDKLKIAAEACFDRVYAYANANDTTMAEVKAGLALCYRQQRTVSRVCNLPVKIGRGWTRPH